MREAERRHSGAWGQCRSVFPEPLGRASCLDTETYFLHQLKSKKPHCEADPYVGEGDESLLPLRKCTQ